jgi:4-amino-4-deoxy-L-arabinose transferase-like glycosyltransferase
MQRFFSSLYRPFVVIGLAMRLAMIVIPGNSILTPWSGGGDMSAYVLMAGNLVSGYGYTYAHVPSAWRTPGYPLVIAGAMLVFRQSFPIAVRCLQVILAILSAYLCKWTADILFGPTAGKAALLTALFFPTLLYFSGEFLSESLAAFSVALFLWLFAKDGNSPHWTGPAGMGLAIGLGAMFRPNVAAIGIIATLGAWLARRTSKQRLQVVLIPLCAGIIFAPWILRNYNVFGHFVLTTKSGTDALCGVLNPESRFLPGWEDRMRALVGHLLPTEVETNSPSRLALGSEIEIDRKCWQATRQAWNEMSWASRIRLTFSKWITYWFSTDQLLNPGQVSKRNLELHVASVAFYWFLLVLGCLGWWTLKRSDPTSAAMLLGYVVLMTTLHTPFVMNTRIRAPLIDPFLRAAALPSY